MEHEAVAEVAVIPSSNPLRLAVPEAYLILVAGLQPSRELAESVFAFSRKQLAPYKRVRHRVRRRAAQDPIGENPPRAIAGAGSGAAVWRSSCGGRMFQRGFCVDLIAAGQAHGRFGSCVMRRQLALVIGLLNW